MASRFVIVVLIAWVITERASSQVTDSSRALFSVGMRIHRSFIIQHTKKLSSEVTGSYPWMAEADLNWHLRNRNTWEYCSCYPRTGISILYTDFNMPTILGKAASVYAFIEPFIAAEHRLNYSIRFGIGPSYLTRTYDEETNPDNLFFSSPVSFLVLLNASVNFRITPRLTFRATGSYNHISNGGFSEPNLGMNFPSIALGMDYSFSPAELPHRDASFAWRSQAGRQRVDLLAGLSAKPTTSGMDEKKYPVYILSANYSHAVGKLLALNGGMEWVDDRSLRMALRENGTVNNSGNFPDHNRAGVLVGMDWLFGRFVFYQHLGIYVYSPVKPPSAVYQRYGLNYRFSRQLFAGVNIKAHGQDADFMDVRIGYAIGIR